MMGLLFVYMCVFMYVSVLSMFVDRVGKAGCDLTIHHDCRNDHLPPNHIIKYNKSTLCRRGKAIASIYDIIIIIIYVCILIIITL